MEWAIELALEFGLPVAATMCVGPSGYGCVLDKTAGLWGDCCSPPTVVLFFLTRDENGVPVGELAVRMAKAGAQIVGVNCLFDPFITLEVMRKMKEALDAFELSPYLMAQPNGYRVPDGGTFGWCEVSAAALARPHGILTAQIPEFPFAMEPRQITRWEARKWARAAYELGVRIIGGCCGFEPYLIRAMGEELAAERGRLPEASAKSDYDLRIHKELESKLPRYKNKGSLDWWMSLDPCTGRPLSTALHRQPHPVTINTSCLH